MDFLVGITVFLFSVEELKELRPSVSLTPIKIRRYREAGSRAVVFDIFFGTMCPFNFSGAFLFFDFESFS